MRLDHFSQIENQRDIAVEQLSRPANAGPTRGVPPEAAHKGFRLASDAVDDQRISMVAFLAARPRSVVLRRQAAADQSGDRSPHG